MAEHDLLALTEENPYTGTAQQVINLCIGIYEASVELDAQTMRALRNQLPITDKIYSKLRVIGKTCSAMPPDQRKVVIKALPDAYSTIHVLCGLKPTELHTAAKSKRISRTTSIRSARDYVKQVRYPALTGNPNAEPTTLTTSRTEGDPTWKTLLTLHEDPSRPLTEDDLHALHQDLEQVCQNYGIEVRRAPINQSINLLQKKERAEKETFWRNTLENEIPQTWFDETPQEIRKQFNLKNLEELIRTPLRQFTGFLVRSAGSRKFMWDRYGRAYVAKIHLEHAKTDDRTQRHNYKRRLEEIYADDTKGGRDLAVWSNTMLKGAGFPID
jgi:hypothetical protein